MKEIEEAKKVVKELAIETNRLITLRTNCWLCGSKKEITKHHLKAITKHGKNEEYIFVCSNCHRILESFKNIINTLNKNKKLSITNFKRMNKSIDLF